MKKETINIITFVLFIISILVYIFTMNLLSFGFSTLFGTMFFVDSITHFVKKKILSRKTKAIGGDYAN